MNKLIVFDLDGTLWYENSHINIVESYYKTKRFSSIIGKLIYKIIPDYYMKELNKMFEMIPDSYIDNYIPHLRKETVNLLEKHMNESIIITNAPMKIVHKAEKLFTVPVFYAPIGEKSSKLNNSKIVWNYLVVITDNLTDFDLMLLADKVIFYANKKEKKYISKMSFKGTLSFREK